MKRILLKDINKRMIVNSNENFFIDSFDGDSNFDIDIKNGVSTQISFLSLSGCNSKVNINIDSKSRLEIYFADFAKNDSNVDVNISLNERAAVIVHLASLTSGSAKKKFNICVDHNSINTYSFVDNYGVIKENGKLVFDGVSYIKNGSVKSKTRQNAKIMVFDENSIGIAKPILKIDENDIEASHGAVVGKISDEHLFYLMSRGLSLDNAKVLITYGYLKPIMNGFEESIQKKIEKLIEGRV